MAGEVVPGGPLSDIDDPIELEDATQGDLQALIDEHKRDGLGSLWFGEIRTAAVRVARRYPPAVYARASSWDEDALGDLVQDVCERMIARGQIDYICDVANDFGHARALIYRQVKMTLIDRRQRTAIDNLFDRAVQRLSEPPFEVARQNPRSWRLSGPAAAKSAPTRRLTMALGALPRLPGNGTERASAIWTGDTLADALTLICGAVGEIEEIDLKRILEEAVTVFATAEVVSDEAGSEGRSGELDPGDLVLAQGLARRLITAFTTEEATVLAGKWMGDSDGDIARRLGVSRPTAAKYKETAYEKVRDELGSQSEAVVGYVFGRLQSLVIVKGGGDAQ